VDAGGYAVSVHEIKKTSYLDIPAKLREMANDLENRSDIQNIAIVLGYQRGHVVVRGYGPRSTPLELAGWLSRGVTAINELLNADNDRYPAPEPTKPPAA